MTDPPKGYQRKLGSVTAIGLGAFLLSEHIWSWGGADLDDVPGHEWYGIILIIGGLLLGARWKGKPIIELPGGE